MHWASRIALFIVVLSALPGAVAAAAQLDRQPTPQRGERSLRLNDAISGATFVSTLGEDGNVRSSVRAGDFLLEKVLMPSGELTIRLTYANDTATIVMTQAGYQVERNGRTARIDPLSQTAEERDAVRAVLLGSQAVRAFRRIATLLENREDAASDAPLITGTLIDAALVHLLDGDPGASKRLGKRITRHRKAAVQPASFRPEDGFRDCVLFYEIGVLNAWDQYWQCAELGANAWSWVALWIEAACELEWLLRAQQYLWQFTGCMMLPI